jgi:hypothetical protein
MLVIEKERAVELVVGGGSEQFSIGIPRRSYMDYAREPRGCVTVR